MPKPSHAEASALVEAGPLLRFASEHVKDVDPSLSLAIAEARDAAESDQWTPQISQKFWAAFAALCDRIHPSSMESIAASVPSFTSPSWFASRKTESKPFSLAERTSSRYLKIMWFVLIALTILQLYVWVCFTVSKGISDVRDAERSKLKANSAEVSEFSSKVSSLPDQPQPGYTNADLLKIDQIDSFTLSLNAGVDSMLTRTDILSRVAQFSRPTRSPALEEKRNNNWFDNYQFAAKRFYAAQVHAEGVQETTSLLVGVLSSFVLPILFGLLGAIAYVIRAISDQIKNTTFNKSSPIRHLMRVALGALAGAVIGLFSGLSSPLSLSPLALAFLAGYGVEAVFSTFDAIIGRFREQPQGSLTSNAPQQRV